MKRLFKRLGITLLGVIGGFLLLLLVVPLPAIQAQQLPAFQEPNHKNWQFFDFSKQQIDSLEELYGKNKNIPNEVKLPVLLALSFYPEFKETPISFSIESELFPYSSRPNISTFLGGERAYIIRISNSTLEMLENLIYKHVPLNALVGVLGHELAHIWFYEQQSRAGLWKVALHYLNPSFSRDWENFTDRVAIHKGLGTQILAWAEYSQELFGEGRKQKEKERYMSPESILAYINQQLNNITE